MRSWIFSWVVVVLLGGWTRAATAQATKLMVSADPGLLRISSAVPGSQPTSVSDATTTYHVKAGSGAKKITGQLSGAMPTGVTLTVTLAAPPGATSLGPVSLDASPRDLVVNIPSGANTTQSISYTLNATAAAGVIPASSRTVTLTLLSYP